MTDDAAADPLDEDQAFEALLVDLRDRRGFDFTGYKRSSLGRRIRKRMDEVGIDDFLEYRDHLEVDPGEFLHLFNTILINVTRFFRDAERWEYLRDEVLPKVIARAEGPIRVWSAGCASGEEPYTIAILLAELLGLDDFDERVKIYATDVDEDALVAARAASYDLDSVTAVPQDLRDRYFERTGDRFQVRPELRRAVIFGRHALGVDAPISRLDLLVCRNVLMYFNAEAQQGVLRHLHFGLKDDGYLFLGKAEMLLTRTDLFEPVNLASRVFRKAPATTRLMAVGTGVARIPARDEITMQVRLRDASFAAAPVAQVVVDVNGMVVLANNQLRTVFGLGAQDIGRPFRDLELSYRPIDLRSPIDQVQRDGRAVQLRNVEQPRRDGQSAFFDVWVVPLHDLEGDLIGVSVTFDDITQFEDIRARLQRSNQDLETAYEELQSSNEELETTNEELQSTVEELETTNEELQSSNEELETMNEELQSATAEQEEVNHELVTRTAELSQVNAYFGSILASLAVGVVVVDPDFEIQIWNDRSSDMWGLRPDEVLGRSLLNLDIGLDVARLAEPIRACLADGRTGVFELPAVNRRGQQIISRTNFSPLLDQGGSQRGVVILFDDAARPIEEVPAPG